MICNDYTADVIKLVRITTERKFGFYNKKLNKWLGFDGPLKASCRIAVPEEFSSHVLYCARNIIEEDFSFAVANKDNNLNKEDWELVEVQVKYDM